MKQKSSLTDRILQRDLTNPDAADGFLAFNEWRAKLARQTDRRAGLDGRRRDAANAAQDTDRLRRKPDGLNGTVSNRRRNIGLASFCLFNVKGSST
jgi:hypothetical protein